MKRLPALFLVLVVAGGKATPAWTPAMEDRIAREATRLMPRSLRSILEMHAEEVRLGLREAAADEGSVFHETPAALGAGPGGAPARTASLVGEIVAMIDGHRPFAEVARRMGALAHVICDLDNPLRVSDQDPHEYRYARDYEDYVESNLERYPLVFYGWRSEPLDEGGPAGRGDVRLFAEKTAARARRYYGAISRAYAPGNPEPLARRFDVRSLPFGVGSLSYSYSVSDTARIWRHVWGRARGDMGGTPYLAMEKRQAGPAAPAPADGGAR